MYETDPVGPVPQPDFFNAVIGIKTTLTPIALLDLCQSIETQYHRRRQIHWGPRTLDIDLLIYGDLCLDTARLTLPHPEMQHRAFVQIPLAEARGEPAGSDPSVRLICRGWYRTKPEEPLFEPGHPL